METSYGCEEKMSDPFNCPKCGAHDFGLYAPNIGECPHCLKDERNALREELERADKRIDELEQALREANGG